MDINYPSDLYKRYEGVYGFRLHKVNSDAYSHLDDPRIFHDYLFFSYNSGEVRITPTSEHMNVRYQVIDYYLPLSDVEKLVSLKIYRKIE
jgi:hypothetical protein